MSTCERFEQEGLILLEQGAPLPEHFSECEACQAAIEQYERLKLSLSKLGADKTPAAGWQDRVLNEIGQSDPRNDLDRWVADDAVAVAQPSSARQWQWIAAMAASVAAVAIYYGTKTAQRPLLGLSLSVGDSGITYRGESAKPGDPLTITATGLTKPYSEIRLYRDGNRLVLACSDRPPCETRGRRTKATIPLDAIGNYRAIVLSAEAPLPHATNNLDADVLAAREQGAAVEISSDVSVQ